MRWPYGEELRQAKLSFAREITRDPLRAYVSMASTRFEVAMKLTDEHGCAWWYGVWNKWLATAYADKALTFVDFNSKAIPRELRPTLAEIYNAVPRWLGGSPTKANLVGGRG